jgi:hypothetical protein
MTTTRTTAEEQLYQLDQTQSLVEVEHSLTEALEKASPWLSLPSLSMQDVEHVLHLARKLASRTSAPAGWNPQAPVMGFATPNPLPHQLRGGALGTLQLELAQAEQERTKKRKKEAEAAKPVDVPHVLVTSQPPAVQQGATTASSANRPRQAQQVLEADMNLSDSSSEEETEDDDDLND